MGEFGVERRKHWHQNGLSTFYTKGMSTKIFCIVTVISARGIAKISD